MARIPTVTLVHPDTDDRVVVNAWEATEYQARGYRRAGETLGDPEVRTEPSAILGPDGAPAADPATDPAPSLDGMTVADLKEAAKALGVTGTSTMTKPKLVEAIEARRQEAMAAADDAGDGDPED
jgi:hypothetical protein